MASPGNVVLELCFHYQADCGPAAPRTGATGASGAGRMKPEGRGYEGTKMDVVLVGMVGTTADWCT